MEYIYNGISAIQCMYHYFVVYFLSGSTFKKMLTGLSTYREVSSRFYFDLFFFKCCIIILLLSIERFNFITKIRLRLKRFSFIISKYLYIYIFILYTRDTFSCLQAERRVASPFLNRRKFQWMRETDPHKFVVRWLKSLLPSNCTQTLVRVLRIPIRQRFFNRENSIIDL